MKQISFTIPGEPRVQKRHRDRKKPTCYDPHRRDSGKYDPSAKDKESFLVQAMAQCRPDEPLEGPLHLIMFCYGKTTGDVDNYLKFVMDALAGPYYPNDKQIRLETVGLYYSKDPRTYVSLSPLEEAGVG